MVGTYSTVEKRAKRVPDLTVETTCILWIKKALVRNIKKVKRGVLRDWLSSKKPAKLKDKPEDEDDKLNAFNKEFFSVRLSKTS